MATTIDAIVDRIRSVCVAAPFHFTESASFLDFSLQPEGVVSNVFRVDIQPGLRVRGGFAMTEERTELVVVEVIRSVDDDYDRSRRLLSRTATSLTSAIIHDGSDSGIYAVPDEGRQQQMLGERGAGFLISRSTLPVNYEAVL